MERVWEQWPGAEILGIGHVFRSWELLHRLVIPGPLRIRKGAGMSMQTMTDLLERGISRDLHCCLLEMNSTLKLKKPHYLFPLHRS
ncbi:hypothetical protein OIU76_016687 [Salix suchowensis]|nr:hypothetical protein OIU76_016687 [Salix suchowensis]